MSEGSKHKLVKRNAENFIAYVSSLKEELGGKPLSQVSLTVSEKDGYIEYVARFSKSIVITSKTYPNSREFSNKSSNMFLDNVITYDEYYVDLLRKLVISSLHILEEEVDALTISYSNKTKEINLEVFK